MSSDKHASLEIESFDNERMRMYKLTAAQRSNAINLCQSLDMAYVMDQVFRFFLGNWSNLNVSSSWSCS
ncbi:hypothetical protein QYF36_022038 [Acer negundo]|nr:hypothetical protein QYF36_022038 [Acer negundo]